MTNLTPLETTVLEACWQAALDSTGGDFACLDEVSVKGLGRKALGGVITSLQEKGVIFVDETFINQQMKKWGGWTRGTRVVQVTFPDEFKAARYVRGENR